MKKKIFSTLFYEKNYLIELGNVTGKKLLGFADL